MVEKRSDRGEPPGSVEAAGGEEDTVMVPVPRRLLGAVYALLGSRMQPRVVAVPHNGSWTAQQIGELAALLDGRARMFVDVVAAANGDWVTYQAAADALGVPVDKLRLDLMRLSAYCKRVRDGEKIWPMEPRVRDQDAELGQRVHYRMEPLIANWWRAATRESNQASNDAMPEE